MMKRPTKVTKASQVRYQDIRTPGSMIKWFAGFQTGPTTQVASWLQVPDLPGSLTAIDQVCLTRGLARSQVWGADAPKFPARNCGTGLSRRSSPTLTSQTGSEGPLALLLLVPTRLKWTRQSSPSAPRPGPHVCS